MICYRFQIDKEMTDKISSNKNTVNASRKAKNASSLWIFYKKIIFELYVSLTNMYCLLCIKKIENNFSKSMCHIWNKAPMLRLTRIAPYGVLHHFCSVFLRPHAPYDLLHYFFGAFIIPNTPYGVLYCFVVRC